MENRVLIGGSGGQGVMLLGTTLATAAINEGMHSSCLPAYGPEMRGGTANCTVVISPEEIITPLPDKIQAAIFLNEPSYKKFKDTVVQGGLLIVNSSIVGDIEDTDGCEVLKVPCNDMALKLGDLRVANMIALGVYIKKTNTLKYESVEKAISEYFAAKPKVVELNCKAIQEGMKSVK